MNQQPQVDEIGIIALVPDRWGQVWMDRHHVLTRLARYFQVVWMYQPTWWECLSSWRSGNGHSMAVPQQDQTLHVYEPAFYLPRVGRPTWLARMTSHWRLKRVSDYLYTQGCTKIVLFLWELQFADALKHIQHDLSVYNVSDEYSFSKTELPVSPIERDLLESVGQVFLISPALMEKKGHFNPNSLYTPCGVDFAKYATPAPEPEDLRHIPHPRIGYLGHLKGMLDWPLLLELSALHPQWSFVFVGPKSPHPEIEDAVKEMSRRPNVHFLGGKSTHLLGAYVQHFSACIMPYVVDDYTKYIYPGKMHEYLASGNPVVSAPIRSVEEFRTVITIVANRHAWSQALERALSTEENTPARRAARQQIAREYDWDNLVRKIAHTIASRLGVTIPDRLMVG